MPAAAAVAAAEAPFILPLSAQSTAALQALALRYADQLAGADAQRVADICFSASTCRDALAQRCSVVGESADELVAALTAAARGETAPGLSVGQAAPGARTDVAFVYSGQGPQWWAMGRELLATEPAFADAVAACDEAMRPHAPWRLLDELKADEAQSRLDQTEIAQPAIFALQVGLTALWREWGVTPAAVLGHSVGEIAAAHAAGVLDLPAAARLAVLRGRIMQAATGLGHMAAIEVDAAEGERLAAASGGRLSLAAINAPRSVVLSGDSAALHDVLAALAARGIEHKLLPVNYAFHSAQMEPFRAQLEAALATLTPTAARVALYSSVSGARLDGSTMDARYWGRNLREPVRFAPAVQALANDGFSVFLELAAHPVLARGIAAVLEEQGGGTVASSLRRGRPERAAMLAALGLLSTRGVGVDWHAVQRDGQRVPLPHYPWQRSRYWVTLPAPAEIAPHGDTANHPLLGARIDSPALTGTLLASVLSVDSPAFLGEHQVGAAAIVPATALVEMALASSAHAASVRELVLHEPLRLSEGARRVQTIVSASGECTTYSRALDADGGEWTRHASCRLVDASAERPPASRLDDVRGRCGRAVDAASLYAGLAELGLGFGANFQGIAGAWFGSGEALAQITTPDALLDSLPRYRFHPALLDACIQPCTELLRQGLPAGEVFLPFAIDAFDLWAPPGAALWSHVRLRAAEGDGGVRIADVDVHDASGDVVASLRGLHLRRATLASLAAKGEACLYTETWSSSPAAGTARTLAGTRWLIHAAEPQQADALVQRLAAAGA
ncbi:MAG TPA: acyltransferase domain-containing protein, partial [Albitalea sp.]|nr:acyltransferase domain-containing protein [Albitalea sp.]